MAQIITEQAIANLIKSGNKQVEVTITNVEPIEYDITHHRDDGSEVVFHNVKYRCTLTNGISCLDRNGDISITKELYVMGYCIANFCQNNPFLQAFAADFNKPERKALGKMLLTNAKISLIQEFIGAGSIYKDPFDNEAEEVDIMNDRYYNHIVGIDFAEANIMFVAKLMLL